MQRALGEGALVHRSMELPALHTQLLTGCLARCHGRGHTGYPRVSISPTCSAKKFQEEQRVKTWNPFSSISYDNVELYSITSQNLGVIDH